MEILNQLVPWIGVGLCLLALFQFAHWSAHSLNLFSKERTQFAKDRKALIASLHDGQPDTEVVPSSPGWNGFRNFRVQQIDAESNHCKSLYLVPADGKPIPTFQPGQHLALRFRIPGQQKPVVRCYSLSDGPNQPWYRITVKEIAAPRDHPDATPGLVSSFIHRHLAVGDQLEVKSPSGHFHLDHDSPRPVVLLAGGIGVTPMISMLAHLVSSKPKRPIIMAYGVKHSLDHAFKNYLSQLEDSGQLLLLTCYSDPLPEDRQGDHFDIHGFVSVPLIRELLPDQDCDFFLCGPPPFMASLSSGLADWGVPPSRIHSEAFGPASLPRQSGAIPPTIPASSESIVVKFVSSGTSANWQGQADSLLELAEEHGIEIESGCRAGSCGSCVTEIISGQVDYPGEQQPDCAPDHCLTCISRPLGPLELRA